MADSKVDVYLICNAKYHDTDFSRLELLKLLAEHEDVVTKVADSYADIEAINASRLLITYTCDLCPTPEQQQGLKRYLENGGKWFALHGTNALIGFSGESQVVDGIELPGKADTPDDAPDLMRMRGGLPGGWRGSIVGKHGKWRQSKPQRPVCVISAR